MRIISLFIALLALVPRAESQILDPVSFETDYQKVSENTYDLTFKAQIEEGWYIYSQFLDEGGPIPTSLNFENARGFEVIGKTEEISDHKKEGHDEIFDMQVVKFAKEVTFRQRIKAVSTPITISGFVEYMTCDDTRCLAPTQKNFTIKIEGDNQKEEKDTAEKVSMPKQEEKDEDTTYTLPKKQDSLTLIDEDTSKADPNDQAVATQTDEGSEKEVFTVNTEPVADCGEPIDTQKSNWGIFILGFLGGLIALLTPCVFPMIPLTVSFFTKGERKGIKGAVLYGFFILMVYLLLSIPFHLMDTINPDILNDISTNVWLNILFFLVFVVFAFSFFGYYELTLPSSWTNKASSAEGAGGVLGIFFMALTLSLVSFSCTGPILGSLLAGALSSDGGAMQLTAGMAGFGLALALPFGLFAAFPGWMKSLPKSGGWMNTIKVVLGFLELALALKFLSNADLVKRWGLLKIEPFLGLWILIFAALGIYLLGKISFPHDSPLKKLKPGRVLFAVLVFVFVGYLASGFRYQESTKTFTPLKLLSGLAPPVGYSWIHPNDCPQNLNCFKDLEEGLDYATAENKPVMLDFTGHACVNCRKMEEHVWPEPQVYEYLNEEFVLISLYVDEKVSLPKEAQKTVETINGGTRTLRTKGQKWAHFQTSTFRINSQPFYVLMTPGGQVLNHPVTYTPDASEYAAFLKCGLDAFERLNP